MIFTIVTDIYTFNVNKTYTSQTWPVYTNTKLVRLLCLFLNIEILIWTKMVNTPHFTLNLSDVTLVQSWEIYVNVFFLEKRMLCSGQGPTQAQLYKPVSLKSAHRFCYAAKQTLSHSKYSISNKNAAVCLIVWHHIFRWNHLKTFTYLHRKLSSHGRRLTDWRQTMSLVHSRVLPSSK